MTKVKSKRVTDRPPQKEFSLFITLEQFEGVLKPLLNPPFKLDPTQVDRWSARGTFPKGFKFAQRTGPKYYDTRELFAWSREKFKKFPGAVNSIETALIKR